MEERERDSRPVLSAEEQRKKNIEENMKILEQLGVANVLPKKEVGVNPVLDVITVFFSW